MNECLKKMNDKLVIQILLNVKDWIPWFRLVSKQWQRCIDFESIVLKKSLETCATRGMDWIFHHSDIFLYPDCLRLWLLIQSDILKSEKFGNMKKNNQKQVYRLIFLSADKSIINLIQNEFHQENLFNVNNSWMWCIWDAWFKHQKTIDNELLIEIMMMPAVQYPGYCQTNIDILIKMRKWNLLQMIKDESMFLNMHFCLNELIQSPMEFFKELNHNIDSIKDMHQMMKLCNISELTVELAETMLLMLCCKINRTSAIDDSVLLIDIIDYFKQKITKFDLHQSLKNCTSKQRSVLERSYFPVNPLLIKLWLDHDIIQSYLTSLHPLIALGLIVERQTSCNSDSPLLDDLKGTNLLQKLTTIIKRFVLTEHQKARFWAKLHKSLSKDNEEMIDFFVNCENIGPLS